MMRKNSLIVCIAGVCSRGKEKARHIVASQTLVKHHKRNPQKEKENFKYKFLGRKLGNFPKICPFCLT